MGWLRNGKAERNEIIEHRWLDVEILWRSVRDQVSDQPGREEVDALIETRNSATNFLDWALLNRTEQRIAAYLSETKLHSQFGLLMADAAVQVLPKLAFHEGARQVNFSTPPVAGQPSANIELKRDAYMALLSDLQAYFIMRRFNRKLRRDTASRLAWTGVFLLVVVSLPFIIFYVMMK